MYYIFGDIHGMYEKLSKLFNKVEKHLTENDELIFLGDYIDRGKHSYEVIEFLLEVEKKYRVTFLKGNHEDMFQNYLNGDDNNGIYFTNGGRDTVQSYNNNLKQFDLPESHKKFFMNLRMDYETDDFIAVHAGLNPDINNLADQSDEDKLWIRESFFLDNKKWPKTVVFGHTPTDYINKSIGEVYFNNKNNIIGIDTGAVYGGKLTCLRMPDWAILQV